MSRFLFVVFCVLTFPCIASAQHGHHGGSGHHHDHAAEIARLQRQITQLQKEVVLIGDQLYAAKQTVAELKRHPRIGGYLYRAEQLVKELTAKLKKVKAELQHAKDELHRLQQQHGYHGR